MDLISIQYYLNVLLNKADPQYYETNTHIKGFWNVFILGLKHIHNTIRFNNFRGIDGFVIFKLVFQFFLSENITVFYVLF